MKIAVKSPEPAVYRRGLGIFLTETPPTDTPKHLFRPLLPRNPLFPVSGPLMSFLKGLRPKSNSLAPVGSRSGPFGEGGVLDHLALAQLREPASRAMAGARLSFIARH